MRRASGFTLLEILIAMAVFVIGVISILAVFPVGIKSSTQSTDHSVAAALAESLDDALTLALRQYSGIAGPTGAPVDFFHDGLPNNGADKFYLPPLETWTDAAGNIGPAGVVYVANGRSRPTWYPRDPADTAASGSDPQATIQVPPASLGSIQNKGSIGSLVGDVAKDFPDPLKQYSFRFMVHEYKVPNDFDTPDEDPRTDLPAGTYTRTPAQPPPIQATYKQFEYQNGTEAEVIDRLYQFTVYIYRGWKPVTCEMTGFDPANLTANTCWHQSGNAEPYTWQDQMKHPNKIERFEFLVYSQGAQQP